MRFYGFFGFGLALYFASQGAGRLLYPLLAGLLRLLLGVGGGWLILRETVSLGLFFLALGVALAVYGGTVGASVAAGVWFRSPRPSSDPRLSPVTPLLECVPAAAGETDVRMKVLVRSSTAR